MKVMFLVSTGGCGPW